jgi:hypothetical protein
MKKQFTSFLKGSFLVLLSIIPSVSNGQSDRAIMKKYLTELPEKPALTGIQKYRMTAVYTNRDLYGNFTGKIKVSGDYTRGLPGDSVTWTNVFISSSNSFEDPFPEGKRQGYMENIKYLPSSKMLEAPAFRNFPLNPENVYARNLIWDMFSAEIFAWKYWDSLELNKPFVIPDINGQFDMAEIGKYSHNKIVLSWQGITLVNGELCAIIDFSAIDNKLELNMDMIKSKGTEQYWGNVQVSLKTGNIEQALLYSGTIQEIEVKGLKDKLLAKTIRELEVTRIK